MQLRASPVHAMMAHGGSRGIPPLILNVDGREWLSERRGRSPPGKVEVVWTFWGIEKFLASTGFRTPSHRAGTLVAVSTSLLQLSRLEVQ